MKVSEIYNLIRSPKLIHAFCEKYGAVLGEYEKKKKKIGSSYSFLYEADEDFEITYEDIKNFISFYISNIENRSALEFILNIVILEKCEQIDERTENLIFSYIE